MKKALSFLLTALFLLTCFSAVAENAADLEAIARLHVPEGAQSLAYEIDDGAYEFKYWIEATQETYEVDILPDTQKVRSVSSESRSDCGSRTIILTDADAQAKALELYPDATVNFVHLDADDGMYIYKVAFLTPDYAGIVQLNPETGAVVERDLDYTYTADSLQNSVLTADSVKDLVLQQLPGSEILALREDLDDNRLTYEGIAANDSWQYEFEIDALTGRFLEWDREKLDRTNQTSAQQSASGENGLISKERAAEIAIQQAGGGRAGSVELDRDDGRMIYEVEVYTDTHEHEFEIDAATGQILHWDRERYD